MIRTILIAVILAALALPLAADEVSSPSFFIERIEVRNATRVSPDVVIAESALREGREYSEAELRDGANRLSRLPFLLSADFSLERGSERGRHVLVITISETKPFFYLLDGRVILGEQYVGSASEDSLANGQEAVLGFRWFVGRRGAIHAGLFGADDNRDYTASYSAFGVGYTQYDVFGSRAFVTLNLKLPIVSGGGELSPQIVAGIPLTINQTLTLNYDETRFDSDEREDFELGTVETAFTQRILSAKWSYNTTNRPFVPTHGTIVNVTPVAVWANRKGIVYERGADGLIHGRRATIDATSLGIDLSAKRYWELSERDSVSAGIAGGWARTDEERNIGDRSFDSTFGVIHAGYSHSLWDRARQKDGDSRFELDVRAATRTREESVFLDEGNNEVFQISGAWVRRSSFGTLRLGLGYAW